MDKFKRSNSLIKRRITPSLRRTNMLGIHRHRHTHGFFWGDDHRNRNGMNIERLVGRNRRNRRCIKNRCFERVGEVHPLSLSLRGFNGAVQEVDSLHSIGDGGVQFNEGIHDISFTNRGYIFGIHQIDAFASRLALNIIKEGVIQVGKRLNKALTLHRDPLFHTSG